MSLLPTDEDKARSKGYSEGYHDGRTDVLKKLQDLSNRLTAKTERCKQLEEEHQNFGFYIKKVAELQKEIDLAYNRGISVAANQTIDDAITLIEMDNDHRSYISEIGMKCFEEGEIITYLESLRGEP